MSMLHNITLSYSMIKVTSQREKETWQMIPQSSPSPSWAALQHNKIINLFPGENNIFKTFQRYRGQHKNFPNIFQIFFKYFENLPKIPRSTRGISTFPNPGGSLGEEKINVKIYFWSLLTWGNHLMIWWSTLYFVVDMFAYMGKPSARTAPTSGTSRLGSSILGIRSEGRRTITT